MQYLLNIIGKIHVEVEKQVSTFTFDFQKIDYFCFHKMFTAEILLVPGQASLKNLLVRTEVLTTRTTRTAYFRTPVG